MRHLIDHANCHGEDRRAGKAAHFVGDHGLFGAQIDAHTQQRVDQANAVRTRILASLGDADNIGNIWRKLDQHRLFGHLFDRRQELDLEKGEVTGSYELAGKAMERITVAAQDMDVIATRLGDTFLHPAQINTYLPHTQRVELYRLYDPDAQAQSKTVPVYKLINNSGPAHNQTFETAVFYNEEQIATGVGKTKKDSEQHAAYNACLNLGIIKCQK